MRKIVMLLLCMSIIVLTALNGFADAVPKSMRIGNKEYIVVEENSKCKVVKMKDGSLEVISRMDEHQYAEAKAKLNKVLKEYKGKLAKYKEFSTNATIGGRIGVPYCKQETTYWCGPAAAQQVIKEDGISVTQQELADAAGTTTSGTASEALVDAMNEYNTEFYYVGSTIVSDEVDDLCAIAEYGYDYDEGCVYLVKTKYLPYYNNKDLTHFISGDGYLGTTNYGVTTIYLVDPHYSSTYADKRAAAPSDLAVALEKATWDYGDGTWRVNVIW